MSKVMTILKGSRPLTWALSVCPVIIATICSAMDSFFAPLSFHSRSTYWLILAAMSVAVAWSMQVSANFINDYLDGQRGIDDNRSDIAPARMNSTVEGQNFALQSALATVCAAIVIGIAAVVLSRQYWLLIVGTVCVAAAWGYSAFLSAYGWGEILTFVFFGPVAMWSIEFMLIRHIGPWVILASIQCGLLCAAVLLVNNMRDEYSDAAAGKRTIVVRWGTQWAQKILIGAVATVWILSAIEIVASIIAVRGHVAAWIIALSMCILGEAIAGCIWIVLNIFHAQNRPALYKRVFTSLNLMMILLALHYVVVFVVVNAL